MVESTKEIVARQIKEREAMRAQISRRRVENIAIPEPLVIQNESPVKGMKVLFDSNVVLLGLDSGEVKVVDKARLSVLSSQKFEEAPVLKVDQVLQAVLIQYKDLVGSIYVCKPPSAGNSYQIEQVQQIKTMSTSFTTFAADVVFSDADSHILLVHTCPDFPHKPKMSVLNAHADAVMEQKHIEALPSALASNSTVSKFTGKPKKGTAGKQTREEELKDERPLEGSVTCLQFSDGCDLLEELELFVGYESGAIGMFRISLDRSLADGTPGRLHLIKLFTAMKLIQDPQIRHILSLGIVHTAPETEQDFSIAVGYYSQKLQTIKFVVGHSADQYTMVDQTITEATYHEKPGIGCQSLLRVGTNVLLATGGFDHRIKLVSMRNLKPLLQLPFHTSIVNNVHLEYVSEDMVKLYSSSEDGYMACWTLQI